MRKPRDFDAELQALNERARGLKDRKVKQLGELVIATGADALDIDTLAGALLAAVADTDLKRKQAHRVRGEMFFRPGASSQADNAASPHATSHPQADRAEAPPASRAGEN